MEHSQEDDTPEKVAALVVLRHRRVQAPLKDIADSIYESEVELSTKDLAQLMAKGTVMLRNRFAASVSLPSEDRPASDTSGASGTCFRCGRLDHRVLLPKLERLLKIFQEARNLRKVFVKHRLVNEDTAAAEKTDSVKVLRSLVKRVITKFKNFDENDYRTVLETQQAINKLKQKGFVSEYNLFQSIHNAKVGSKSEACTGEITKLFEKCHL